MASGLRRVAARFYWRLMESAVRFRPQRMAELANAQLAARARGPPSGADQFGNSLTLGSVMTTDETLAHSEILAANLARIPGNPAHSIFYQQGFHLLRRHFYLPIPEELDLEYAFAARN